MRGSKCSVRGREEREEGENPKVESARHMQGEHWCHQPTNGMDGHNLAAPHGEENEDNRKKDPQQILPKDIAGQLVEVLVSWKRERTRHHEG